MAIALDPDDAIFYVNRGLAYDHKGDYDAAISDYEAALRIDPQYEWARENLGRAHRAKGQQS